MRIILPTFTLALSLLFGSACVTHDLNTVDPAIFVCKKDSDCVLAPVTCCGCNSAGTREAINNEAAQRRQAKFLRTCGEIMCAQMISQDPSCAATAKAVCLNGKCEINN